LFRPCKRGAHRISAIPDRAPAGSAASFRVRHSVLSLYDLRRAGTEIRRFGRANVREVPMNVETILRNKGNRVATIRPEATVTDAIAMLNRERIGALVVSENGQGVDGILSERDIVMALADHGADLLSRPISAIMTRNVLTCEPSDTVAELMAEMT